MRDSAAARDLLYRRARSLANYENANKNLDKARAKNKDVLAAENAQQVSFTPSSTETQTKVSRRQNSVQHRRLGPYTNSFL